MITWLPAIVSIKEGLSWKYSCFKFKTLSSPIMSVGKKLEEGIMKLINVFPLLWIILLSKFAIFGPSESSPLNTISISGVVGVLSGVIVLYWPKLQLPDSADFKLFVNNHPFEVYDTVYKDRFWFEKVYTVSCNLCLLCLKHISKRIILFVVDRQF